MVLEFEVPGEVIGKPRPRVTRNGTFMPKKYISYLKVVTQMTQFAMRGQPPTDRPVRLVIDTYKSRPKSRPKSCLPEWWKTGEPSPCPSKPDADNAAGSLMDGMEKGGAFTMDSRVFDLHVRTWYCAKGGKPRAHVRMETL